MLKRQWEDLKDGYDIRSSCRYNQKKVEDSTTYVLVKSGKNKGKTGRIIAIGSERLTAILEDGSEDEGDYGKYTLLDEHGRPDEHVRDSLGAPIEVGAWVAYSQAHGVGHTLEIGRVKTISAKGSLTVIARMRDGRVLDPDEGPFERRAFPYRTIKIPVDPARMMMAIFTDFESTYNGQFD